jgi:hypothetical protein
MNYPNRNKSTAIAVAVAFSVGSALVNAATSTYNLASAPRFVGTEEAAARSAADPVAVVGLPQLIVEIESSSYSAGDIVTLAIAGGTVRTGADIGVVNCVANGAATGTLRLTYNSTRSSGNNIVLDVGNVSGTILSGSDGLLCDFPANSIKMLASSMASQTSVTLTYNATLSTGGAPYDTLTVGSGQAATSNVVMAFSRPQLAITPASGTTRTTVRNPGTNLLENASTVATDAATSSVPFNNRIGSSTTVFAAHGTTSPASENAATAVGYSDVLRWVVRNEESSDGLTSVFATNPIVNSSNGDVLITTITGDWSFLDDDANGCTVADFSAGANILTTEAGNTTGVTITADCQTLTRSNTISAAAVRDIPYEIIVRLAGYDGTNLPTRLQRTGRSISARSFSMTVAWKESAAAATNNALLSPTAGSWSAVTTGSSSAKIGYLPYGSGISRIVYVTNNDSVAGVASFSATVDGGTACASTSFPTVAIPAGAVVNVGGAIDAGLRACVPTIDANSGKAAVTVTVTNGTATSTSAVAFEVASSYNVSGNRNVVINSSNR